MVPMTESAFFHDPFVGVSDPKTIIEHAQKSELVLDIDTKNLFDGVDPYRFSMAEMKAYVFDKLSQKMAKVTPFEPDPERLVTLPMKKGQFVIFTERTMHGSLPNTSDKNRVAINCRVTFTDTLIYPGRLEGDYIDGSNIDISAHRCVLLSGEDKNGQNVY
jgi:non-heme Fe2+,alpha-ketoglutarate-dependent halogenase